MPTGPELNDDYKYRNFRMAVQGLASEIGTATATAGAVTLNDLFGLITTESLTTAQNAVYTLTVTNSRVRVGDLVFASVGDGTNTQGTPVITRINVASGSFALSISNLHASAQALNGTLRVRYMVVDAL